MPDYIVHKSGQNLTPTILEGVYRQCIIPTTIMYHSSLRSTEWVTKSLYQECTLLKVQTHNSIHSYKLVHLLLKEGIRKQQASNYTILLITNSWQNTVNDNQKGGSR